MSAPTGDECVTCDPEACTCPPRFGVALASAAAGEFVEVEVLPAEADRLPERSSADPWNRRYRFAVPVTVEIDVDVSCHPGDTDIVQYLTRDLMDEMRRNPNGWQRRFARMYPEIVAMMPGSPGKPRDVGPGVG